MFVELVADRKLAASGSGVDVRLIHSVTEVNGLAVAFAAPVMPIARTPATVFSALSTSLPRGVTAANALASVTPPAIPA
jgi:hypothetical protein